WLQSDLSAVNGNDTLEFMLDYTDIVTDISGSQFGLGVVESGNTNCKIDIVATQLNFVTNKPPATVNTNNDFEVSVTATDVNGNIDVDETSSVTIVRNSGTGILSSVAGTTQNLASGIFDWIDANYNTSETFDIEAQSSTLTNAISISINCVLATIVTVGAAGDYTTIELAYNTGIPGIITGPYIIEIRADYNSSNELPPITLPQKTGHSSANTITIRPVMGVTGVEVSLDAGSGFPVFDLEGCDYVIIDGRPGGIGANREILIRNERTAATVASVVNLINDATRNTLTYLNIEGEAESNYGLVKFSTTSGTTGNDNNTVSFCHIRDIQPSGGTMPAQGISSTGTVAKENDNNTIDNCHFYDIFNTSGSQTASIHINTNSSSWTISNNHFYQTVVYSGLTSNGGFVFINAGGGHTLNNNFFGGTAPSAGGGSKFIISSGTIDFIPIAFLSGVSGALNTIQNNVISNISYITTSTFGGPAMYGILLTGSSDFLVGGIGNGNTIGSKTVANDITLTVNSASGSLGLDAIRNQASATTTISYNIIGGLTVNGTRAGATSNLIVSVSGTTTIDGNTLGSTLANNILVSSNSRLYGVNSSSASGITVTNNTIQNIDHNGTSTLIKAINNTAGPLTCTDNIIQNITTAGNVTHNIIDHAGGIADISRNIIQDITLTSTGSGLFNGINLNSASAVTINANTIGGSSANNITIASSDFYSNGINSTGAGALTCTGNTIQQVNMTGTGASTFQGISTTAGVLTFTGNTVQNITTACNGGGGNIIIGIYCNSVSTGHLIDQNTVKNLTATATGSFSNLIRGIRISNGSGTIEKNHFSDFSMAYSSTGAAMDIINMTTGTWDVFNNVVLISNGSNVNSVKIQGIRLTGTGTARIHHNTIQISGNVSSGIASTAAFFSTNTGTKTLNNNIFQNLRTGTGLHYAENRATGGTYATNYNYIENTQAANLCNNAGTDYNLAGWQGAPVNAANSISGTETLDASGHTAVGFVGADVGTDLTSIVPDDKDGNTRSTTPWMGAYEGCIPINGQFTIGGTAPDFATIAAAITQLTSCGINGPTTFNLRNGTYNEQITIPAINGVSSIDTIVFQSESGDSSLVTWTFAANITDKFTLKLDGASFITIQDLTLQGTNTSYAHTLEIVGTSTDNIIRNNRFIGVSTTSAATNLALVFSDNDQDDNNLFLNNAFTDGSYGLYLLGTSTVLLEVGTIVSGNVFTNQSYRAIDLRNQDAPTVLDNKISTTSTGAPDFYGIICSYCDNTLLIDGNTVETSTTEGIGIQLSFCDAAGGTEGLIRNNFIQIGISGTSNGIYYSNSTFQKLYSNSINLTSTDPTNGTAFRQGGGSDLFIQNNLFVNSGGGYAMDVLNTTSITVMDNDDLFTSGTNIGNWGGAPQTTFANWQTAVSPHDAISVNIDPLFVSSTDLHLTGSSPIALQAGADLSTDVPNDIDGDTRPATPWMGADEICSMTANITDSTMVTCTGNADGTAAITPTGGSGPYTFSWNTSPVQTDSTATGLSVGIYTGIIIDVNGCTDTDSVATILIIDTWVQRANFGSTSRKDAVAFSIGGKGYIGTGTDGGNKKDFWEYNQANDTWTQKADFGGTARFSAVGFSIIDKGYIGTGFDGAKKNDFWEYDTTSNSWTQKANFGGAARNQATGFSIGPKGYIGTGLATGFVKDFWEYNQGNNTWTQKADFGGTARRYATGFSINENGYIGTGWDGGYTDDLWEYDTTSNTWTQKANFGGTARNNAKSFAIGDKGYIGLGHDGGFTQDVWEYNPGDNTWTQKANFSGGARRAAVGMSINSKGYFGTGDDGVFKQDFWEYNSALSAGAGIDDTICTGNSVIIGSGSTGSGGASPYTYAWLPSASLDDATLANPTATPGSITTYTLTVTDANGCTSQDTMVVRIETPMAGTYTVGGAVPDYATITDAVDDLICKGISANVIIDIRDGTYNEQVTIPDIAGTGVNDSIIIQSESLDSSLVTWTFAANATDIFTLKLNSADRITIQHLTIQATDGTYAVALVVEAGADSNHYRNNRFMGISTTGTSNNLALVYSAADVDNNNEFSDNRFIDGSSGLIFAGTAPGTEEAEVIVQRNVFINQAYTGIGLWNSISPRISDNIISTNSTRTDYDGIYCQDCELNLIIEGNTFESSAVGGNGIDLLNCDGTSGNEGLIANNFVQIGATGSAGGILIANSTYQKCYSNSINLTSTNVTLGAAFKQTTGSNHDIQNNLFVNSGGGYAVDVGNTAGIVTMDNNDLYSSGTNIGNWGGTPEINLTNWQTAVSPHDAASVSVDPLYLSSTDLHLTGPSPTALQAGADLSTDVPSDIDGDTRPATPWMGADELIGANRYWIGLTGGDWNNTAMWSTTSGGAGGASVPAVGDDVYFDSNSFTTTGTCTMNGGTWYCNTFQTLDIAKTPTITGTGVLIVTSP
ncbi:MAG: hypothetical protein JKX73_06955, partial [Flavobacteriales bacterium]|nr:hypothetical protein [Flavobacteriales bacterium]